MTTHNTSPDADGPSPRPNIHTLRAELEHPETAAEPIRAAAESDSAAEAREAPDRIVYTGTTWDVEGQAMARRARGEIFPGCPVVALGVHGEIFYYLDWLGQLQPVTNHTKDRMRGIFGGQAEMLKYWFPQFAKGANAPTGWAQEDCATQMVRAATEKGVWNAFEKVRGLGAWPDDEGGVILHCGDKVLHKGKWLECGEIEGYVYPSAPRVPRPATELPGADPAEDLLDALNTWAWLRPGIDGYLLLGWICSAIFGGALDWRALVWITGDRGTGKSSLHKIIRHVMGGEGAILQSTDATEASVRQFLMQSTVPVALDEVEAEADNRKVLSVVKLARQAASGGVILRGGADHKGQEFKARSSFLFSSILVPSLLDQDISRIAMLELFPLPRGSTPPDPDPKRWTTVGRQLRARVIEGWPRLHETLSLYRQALSAAGHDARGCDQFGTLLAMADLALYDDVPSPDRCDQWAGKLSAATISEQTEEASDWQRCLNHLMGQIVNTWRGGVQRTVGRWILIAAGLSDEDEIGNAERALRGVGLRVYGRREDAALAIANGHPGLSELFEGTHWYAPAGQRGVWAQATKRIPGSEATKALRFDLVATRARKFPLRAIPAFSAEDETTTAEPSATFSNDPNDFA